MGADRRIWDDDALRKGLFCLPLPEVGPGLLKDCETLLAARDALAGGAGLNWRRTTPLALWEGVLIAGAPLRVIGLELPKRGLLGWLPAELAALDRLEKLQLTWNALKGSIPPELGGLRRLRELELQNNALTGVIPQELGGLPLLSKLRLAGNAFAGAAPAALREVADHDLDDDLYCVPHAGAGCRPARGLLPFAEHAGRLGRQRRTELAQDHAHRRLGGRCAWRRPTACAAVEPQR